MFHRIIFLLLIVRSLFCNFNRCAVCFQSFMNISCKSTQNVARIKRFSRLHIIYYTLYIYKWELRSLALAKSIYFSRFDQLLGCVVRPVQTGLNKVCACAETGEVWDLNQYRLQKDFLNILTFCRLLRWFSKYLRFPFKVKVDYFILHSFSFLVL